MKGLGLGRSKTKTNRFGGVEILKNMNGSIPVGGLRILKEPREPVDRELDVRPCTVGDPWQYAYQFSIGFESGRGVVG